MEQDFSKDNLIFWCKTSEIDKIVMETKGMPFNWTIALEMEKVSRHYFVVNKEGQFKILGGPEIEPYKVNNKGRKKFTRIYTPLDSMLIIDPFIIERVKEYIKNIHGINAKL